MRCKYRIFIAISHFRRIYSHIDRIIHSRARIFFFHDDVIVYFQNHLVCVP